MEASKALATRDVKVGQFGLSTIVEHQLWKSADLAKVANITFPVTALDQLPPLHKPSISVITVNPEPKAKDVYPIAGGQMGLSKHVILKMLNAAGAHVQTRKLTPDTDLDYIRWTAVVWGKLPDGTMHSAQGSKAWSWEKCQQEMQPAQAKQYRQFADEQTETKALLRAARAFLNIKTSYNQEELAKPFLIARSVPDLPLDDPEVKRAVVQRMLDSTFSLYGAPQDAPVLPPVNLPELPGVPDPGEFEEDDADGGTFAVGRAVDQDEEDDDFDLFSDEGKEAEIDDATLTERLVAIGKSVGAGGIGKTAMAEILSEFGLTSLTSAPREIRLEILARAERVKGN